MLSAPQESVNDQSSASMSAGPGAEVSRGALLCMIKNSERAVRRFNAVRSSAVSIENDPEPIVPTTTGGAEFFLRVSERRDAECLTRVAAPDSLCLAVERRNPPTITCLTVLR
jgi:hypothetical protein